MATLQLVPIFPLPLPSPGRCGTAAELASVEGGGSRPGRVSLCSPEPDQVWELQDLETPSHAPECSTGPKGLVHVWLHRVLAVTLGKPLMTFHLK